MAVLGAHATVDNVICYFTFLKCTYTIRVHGTPYTLLGKPSAYLFIEYIRISQLSSGIFRGKASNARLKVSLMTSKYGPLEKSTLIANLTCSDDAPITPPPGHRNEGS